MRGKPNCWAVHPVVLRVRERVRTARETPHRMKPQGWYTFCIVKLMSGKPWVSRFLFFFLSSLWAFALITIHNTLSQYSDHPVTPDTFPFLWLLSLTFLNFYFLLFFLQQYTRSRHPLSPFGYSSLFFLHLSPPLQLLLLSSVTLLNISELSHLHPFWFSLDGEKMKHSSPCYTSLPYYLEYHF